MINLEQEQNVIELRGLNNSYDTISQALGISKPKVMAICKKNTELIKSRQETLIKANEESFREALRKRSVFYTRMLDNLTFEALSRDLSSIPLDRLVSLIEKLERILTMSDMSSARRSKGVLSFDNMSDDELESFIRN